MGWSEFGYVEGAEEGPHQILETLYLFCGIALLVSTLLCLLLYATDMGMFSVFIFFLVFLLLIIQVMRSCFGFYDS